MKKHSNLEKCTLWWKGGYYVNVYDRSKHRIVQKHISDPMKDAFVKEFGNRMINEIEFENWYMKIYRERPDIKLNSTIPNSNYTHHSLAS